MNINRAQICVYFLSISSFASLSVIASFFPSQAAKKGMSASLAGGVFSTYGVIFTATNAITGKILPLVGSKIILSIGILVLGFSSITFGLLEYVNQTEIFIVLCFLVRAIEGIGAAFMYTSFGLILIKKSGDNLSKAVAIKEACDSIGFTVGPPLGSLLYAIGGYKLPFLIFGIASLIPAPFALFAIENYKEDVSEQQEEISEHKLSYKTLLSMPKVVAICLTVFTIASNIGVNFSTLALYLEQYDIGAKYVGFVIVAAGASYATISLLVGHFLARFYSYNYITAGTLINTFAFMLIGPSPFFVADYLIIIISALLLIGAGNAFALSQSMPTILRIIADNGYSKNVCNSSYVSGLCLTFYSIGVTFGPEFGAALLQYFGAKILYTVVSSMNLLCAITLLLLLICGSVAKVKHNGYADIDGLAK